jgi:hypothetical protein
VARPQPQQHQTGHRRAGCVGLAEAGTGGTIGIDIWRDPMVSGSAAPHPGPSCLAAGRNKALLVNTAETQIQINPVAQPGVPAPITRIGGGEVRVNRAFEQHRSLGRG